MGARVNTSKALTFEAIMDSHRRTMRHNKAEGYGDFTANVRRMMYSGDETERAIIRKHNEALDALNTRRNRAPEEKQKWQEYASAKGVGTDAVAHDPVLTAMSVQYANAMFIGTELMPVTPVPSKSAQYFTFPQGQRHSFPDDTGTPDGEAREIEETRSKANVNLSTYMLKNKVDAETLQEQSEPLDEMMDMVDAVNEGLAFKRELRIAAVMQAAGNYSTSNKTTPSAANKWDSPGGGAPVSVIKSAVSALWNGRGQSEIVGWCGRDVFDVLCQHPAILELFKFVEGGLATPEMIAMMFGMDRLLVGSARKDTANEGQGSPSYSRIWSNYFGVCRVANTPTRRNASFGKTFRYQGDPVTLEWFDAKKGKGGSFHTKVGIDEQHAVIAADTGYLVINPLT